MSMRLLLQSWRLDQGKGEGDVSVFRLDEGAELQELKARIPASTVTISSDILELVL